MAITLDGTTGISSVDGSSASPSVRGADSNSGIVYAADTVSISTGGTERLEVDSSGNIDIPDNGKIRLGGSADLSIYHDGSNNVFLGSPTILLKNSANSESYLRCNENGEVSLYYNGVKKCQTADYGLDAYTIKPYDDNAHDLGASDQRWDDVYATNGTIQTSDRNAKKDIVKSDLGLTFINAVEPVSYKFKTGTRTHYGVIAQDLETVLDGKDFAGLTKDTETGNYGVRYTELISPLIKAVQELSAEVETLKTKVAALEAA